MNADGMRSALTAFAALVGGDSPRAGRLRRLTALFEGMGEAKVTAIVMRIEKNWKASNRTPRHPRLLKEDLTAVQRALEDSTAKTQAKVIAAVLKLLQGTEDQPVESFVSDAIAARLKTVSPPRRTTTITSEHAQRLAAQLVSLRDDRSGFDNLLGELKAHCKAAQLNTIAKFYTGYETGKTKKDDIISVIRNWQRSGEMNRDRRASQAKVPL